MTVGGSIFEQKELEYLNKAVAKSNKVTEFNKMRQDDVLYNNQAKSERAQLVASRVENAVRAKRKESIQTRRKVEQRESNGENRTAMLREELVKQNAFKKEAARLRAEEQKEVREDRVMEKK